MFHHTGFGIRPDPYTTCNGFVRADYQEALLPLNWPLYQCPPYPPPSYQNISRFIGGPIDTNGRDYTIKPQQPSLNKSHRPSRFSGPHNSRPSLSTPRDSSGSDSSSSRHLSPQSTSLDWHDLAQYVSDIALHQELQWHRTWTPHSPGLHWDVIRPPSTTRALSSRFNIVVPDFNSPALHKPVERLELWSDHPVLACYMHELNWGSVPVGASPTVLELIRSIYDYLSTPLTNDDMRYVYSTPQNGKLLERARKYRVEEGYYAINDVEHNGPFRRSDVLGSHRCFQGVRAVKTGDGKDVLFFNIGPGRVPRY